MSALSNLNLVIDTLFRRMYSNNPGVPLLITGLSLMTLTAILYTGITIRKITLDIVEIKRQLRSLDPNRPSDKSIGFQIAAKKGESDEYIEGYRHGKAQGISGIDTNETHIFELAEKEGESYYAGFLEGYYYGRSIRHFTGYNRED